MIKTFVQRAISYLPRSDWWNGQFQRYVTKGLHLNLEGEFRGKLKACQKHYIFFRSHGGGAEANDYSVVELGTGWFPILPIGFYLCGAAKVWTHDIAPLVTAETLRDTLRCFLLLHDAGTLSQLLPAYRPERMERLRQAFSSPFKTARDTLAPLEIHLVIGDVRTVAKANSSVDFIFSNGVLEHLPRRELEEVFAVFQRWLKTDGVMSHHIGLADQFASFDRTITPFNFLRYSRRWWRWLDNPIIPQNRLRHSDYLKAMTESGFEVVAEERHPGKPEDLASIPLSVDFAEYARSDLLILESWVVARRMMNDRAEHNRVPTAAVVREN